MEYKVLTQEKHIDFPEGFKCRFITSFTESEVLHRHEYYEIFLTLSDNITHHINSKTEILKKGTLTFIRPNDVHLYTHANEPYTFVNLAFSTELANSIFACLGESFPINAFLTLEDPPSVTLSENDMHDLNMFLCEINMLDFNNSKQKTLYCKMILITIFAKYLSQYITDLSDSCPEWLNEVCRLMSQKIYFSEGIEAMVRLSGKSYEHLSRSIKKYKNITLSEFVNNIRLNHAANLLKHTNLSITDIAMECGYYNISYFPTCFRKKYGVSPTEFRRN